MIAVIATFVLPALFAVSGLFALATLALSWRHYGREFAAIRAQLAASSEVQAVWAGIAAGPERAAAAPRLRVTPAARPVAPRPALPRQAARQPALRVAA